MDAGFLAAGASSVARRSPGRGIPRPNYPNSVVLTRSGLRGACGASRSTAARQSVPVTVCVGLRSVWVAGLFWLPSCSGVRPVPLPLCSVSILFRSSFCCGWRYVPFAVLFWSPFYPAAMPSRCRSVPVVIENSFPLPFLNDCPSLSVRY